jgi:hypothetical protein
VRTPRQQVAAQPQAVAVGAGVALLAQVPVGAFEFARVAAAVEQAFAQRHCLVADHGGIAQQRRR